jgi:hypothetical protein
MEISVIGYFKKFNKKQDIILVNLEKESMKKLHNCGKNLNLGYGYNSPILPNGFVIKHDTGALVYDIDNVPATTDSLMGQKVTVWVKTRKYRFRPKKDDDFIYGWTAKLIKMKAF